MSIGQAYPLDGVVLTTGCDKTTPAALMAAATVNLPAIALSVGPMLNGWHKGERTGSGTIVWKARELLANGKIDDEGFIKLVASSAPSTGYCNTMGTATMMNSVAKRWVCRCRVRRPYLRLIAIARKWPITPASGSWQWWTRI